MSKELVPMLKKALFQSISITRLIKEMGQSLPELLLFVQIAPTFLTQSISNSIYAKSSYTSEQSIAHSHAPSTGPWLLASSLWLLGGLLNVTPTIPTIVAGWHSQPELLLIAMLTG